jgi:hypothetical protein
MHCKKNHIQFRKLSIQHLGCSLYVLHKTSSIHFLLKEQIPHLDFSVCITGTIFLLLGFEEEGTFSRILFNLSLSGIYRGNKF